MDIINGYGLVVEATSSWIRLDLFFVTFFKNVFIFGYAGSSLLHGLSLVAVSGGYSPSAVQRLPIAEASLTVEPRL